METISSIHELDTTALDRIEAERADERRRAGEAANAATRRAALLRAGLGIGAAAAGAGLGIFLALYGVSLLMDRPTLDQVAAAMREQVAVADRLARDREDTVRREAEARLAGAEEKVAAAAEAQRLAEEKAATAEKAAAANATAAKAAEDKAAAIVGKFAASSPGKTVVNFTIFRTHVVEKAGIVVVTGWNYDRLEDPAPSAQYCYLNKRPDGIRLDLAQDEVPLPFDAERARKAEVSQADARQALPHCEWFKGSNPNIRKSAAPGGHGPGGPDVG